MTEAALQHRSVAQLSVHPAVALAWQMPAGHPRMQSLIESVRAVGVIDPLKITADGRVVDGRHRLRAAQGAELESVPCLVVAEDRVSEIALITLAERRHLVTSGQLAYAGYPLFSDAHRQILSAHGNTLWRGKKSSSALISSLTVADLADRIGVSEDEFKRAARLHEIFADRPDLREEWEAKIMDPDVPIGLGAAISGIAGQGASTGRSPQRNTALHNWEVGWRNLLKPARSWERWDDEERDLATARLRESLIQMPDPVLDALTHALRAARRARNGGSDGSAESRLESLGLLSRSDAANGA